MINSNSDESDERSNSTYSDEEKREITEIDNQEEDIHMETSEDFSFFFYDDYEPLLGKYIC